MQTPDVTPVQKLVASAVTLLATILTSATALGVDISAEEISAILGLATALGGFFVVADAVIRHGRSGLAATQANIDYDAYRESLARLDAERQKVPTVGHAFEAPDTEQDTPAA